MVNNSLDVGIIGGGLAGLSAAIALKRGGHKVELFERGDFSNESIALSIAPNAGMVYDSWGFDMAEVGGCEIYQVRHVDGATGETTWTSSVKDCPEKYGARFIFLKHADLHAGLLKHLKATEGHEVKIHINTNVTDINCEGGTLTTSTGSVFEKDLIVVSNGLGCKFLETITGKECPLIDTGLSFFRFMGPDKEITGSPLIRPLFEGQDDEICFLRKDREASSIVTYLIQNRETRVVNAFAPRSAAGDEGKAERSARVSQQALLNLTKTYNPSVQEMMRRAPKDGIFAYPLNIRDPITKYVNGKVVVIGDAAHLMKPVQGQGASISIESTGCLEILFKGIGKEDVSDRLHLFESLRLGRCGPTQVFSCMPLSPDGYGWMQEKIKPFWDPARPLPPPGSRALSDPFKDFLYGYNVIEESKKALQKHLRSQPPKAPTTGGLAWNGGVQIPA